MEEDKTRQGHRETISARVGGKEEMKMRERQLGRDKKGWRDKNRT